MVLGIGIAGVARWMSSSVITQRNIDLGQKLDSFHSALTKTMQTAAHCNATFYSQAVLNPTSLVAPPDQTIYLAGDPSVANTVGLTSALTPPGSPFINVATSPWIDSSPVFRNASTRTWRIENISLSPATITTATPAASRAMVVTYKLNPNLGDRTVTRKIPLFLRFGADTGVFLECMSPQASTVNNAQNSLCYGMDPTAVTTTGEIAVWNEETQRCDLVTNPIACPAGTSVRGLNADGTLRCMPTEEGVENRIPSPTATTCAPGQSMRVNYVGGVMSIQCI